MVRRQVGVRSVAQVAPTKTGNAEVDRAQGDVATAVNQLTGNPLAQAVALEVELEWGVNKVPHGLGVPVRHFLHAAPSDPDARITSRQDGNPIPQSQVWVQLDGAAACKALIFLLPVT